MANYFRITAYHPTEDISVIMDANGLCEKLWQFSASLIGKGFKILEANIDGQFDFGNIDKCNEVSDKILLRACAKGKPVYNGKAVTVNGMYYTPNING